jgi:cytochrome d ubiquinol oxidase subunit II
MQNYAWWLGAGTLGFIGIVSILTPFQDPEYFRRWFNLPGSIFSVLMPGAVAATAWALFSGLNAGKDGQPFFAALSLFVLSFIGIGVSFYPNIVPPNLTIVAAAAPDESLLFALVGTVVLVPLILIYTGYAYWVFRGKIDPEEGYH